MVFKSKISKTTGFMCCLALISCVQVSPLGKRRPVGTVSAMLPLHAAAVSGDLNAVKRQLGAGNSIGELDEHGLSPIHRAVLGGHFDVVKLLLDRDADVVGARDYRGYTPLHTASAMGNGKIVELLLDHHATVHFETRMKETPLLLASMGGHERVVAQLLRAGADANAADNKGRTPLFAAVSEHFHGIVERLLEAGARADIICDDGDTPLTVALGVDLRMVELLLRQGASANRRHPNGLVPLHFLVRNAIHKGISRHHLEIIPRLIDAGADINALGGEKQWSALHFAAEGGLREIVDELLKCGAYASIKSVLGETPFELARKRGRQGVACRLIRGHAEVGIMPKAEQILIATGNSWLIDRQLTVRKGLKQRLFDVIERDDVQGVEVLLKVGVDIHQQDEYGKTALMLGAQKGNIKLVEKLVDHDVWAVFVRDDKKSTAYDYACSAGHIDVAQYLQTQQDSLRSRIKQAARGKKLSKFAGRVIEKWRENLREIREWEASRGDEDTQSDEEQSPRGDGAGQEPNFQLKDRTPQGAVDKPVLSDEQFKARGSRGLFEAISQSDLTAVQQCLRGQIDPLYKNEHGNTVLMATVKKAIKTKREQARRIVRELLTRDEIRESVNEPSSNGVTVLMMALDDIEIIGFLFDECKQNLDLGCMDAQGQTVFAYAAKRASTQVMRTLLAFAKGNIKSNELWDILTRCDHKELTATMIAARSGKYENAALLLQVIESLAALNDDRERHVSQQKEWVKQCRHSHPDAMSSIEFDEDDQKEEPAELRQAQQKCIDFLRAGLWQQFNESLRAHEHVPSWIRDQVVVDGQRTTVLHLALEATDSLSQKFFKGLLSTAGGRVVNLTDDRGRQPLDLAIATGKRGLIKALLTDKAQVQARHITDIAAIVATVQNQAEQKYWQVLHDAMKNKRDAAHVAPPTEYKTKEAVATEKQSDKQKQLLAKIADKSAAFRDGWIKELLSTGFDVNEKLEQQMTLLMRAADAGSLEAVDVLLKAGANVNAKDAHGDTAFAYASRAAHTALANRLCVAMAEQGFKKKPSALGHIMQRHACKAPKSLKSRGMNVKDRPFFIEEMRTIRDNGKTMRKKCKAHQFPESWNKQKIQKAIGAVLSNPQQVVDNHAEIDDSGTVVRGTLAVEGVAHGLNMRVVVSNAREAARWCVFTAYPLLSSRTR